MNMLLRRIVCRLRGHRFGDWFIAQWVQSDTAQLHPSAVTYSASAVSWTRYCTRCLDAAETFTPRHRQFVVSR